MVLTWTKLWFHSTNKSTQESNIGHAIGHCCHVSYGVCLNTAVKMMFSFCLDCSEPSVMRNDVLNFTPGVWLVYKKGNIASYIMTSFLLWCSLGIFFCSFSAHQDPCVCVCAAPGLYRTWCCRLFTASPAFLCTCVSSLTFIKVYVYEIRYLFFSFEHPRVRLYECFPPFYWESGKKTRGKCYWQSVFLCCLTGKEIYFFC